MSGNELRGVVLPPTLAELLAKAEVALEQMPAALCIVRMSQLIHRERARAASVEEFDCALLGHLTDAESRREAAYARAAGWE